MHVRMLRTAAVALLVADLVLVLIALSHAIEFEPTDDAAASSAKGQAMGIPAGLSMLAAAITLAGSRRRWALGALLVGLALAVSSLVVLLTR